MAYSVVTISTHRSADEQMTTVVVMAVSWLAFIIDPIVRLALTARPHRRAFFRKYRIDFASALLPILRPFTLLRHLHNTPGFIGNGGSALRSRVIATAAAYALMFVYLIAITVLQVERPAEGGTIKTFGEAIWWACVTLATVGYGDYVPVTPIGRTLAVTLMAGGVVIIGTASAVIVSYLSERIGAHNRAAGLAQHYAGPVETARDAALPSDGEASEAAQPARHGAAPEQSSAPAQRSPDPGGAEKQPGGGAG